MTGHIPGLLLILLCGTAVVRADAPIPGPAAADQAADAAIDPIQALDAYLAAPAADRPAFDSQPFATIPLTRTQAAAVREKLWDDHLTRIRAERRAEWEANTVILGEHTMRLKRKTMGNMPPDGWSLFISMHGGGGTTADVNDAQWSNQHNLYPVTDALVIAPRAPTDAWNMWHQSHIDPMFDRLIAHAVAFDNVNRNRVYLVGYSAGGDGVYQLAPRMADRFAAAAMMAGHPNESQPDGLRNLPFALHVGAEDSAYNRNKVAREWAGKLAALHKRDPRGYIHQVGIHEGLGHWMQLREVGAIAWMQTFERNAVPDRIVWRQDDVTHDRFYWLAVPPGTARKDALVIAERRGQQIDILEARDVERLTILLDDRIANLDRPIRIRHRGRTLFQGPAPRTAATLHRTLTERGDRDLAFDAAVTVDLTDRADAPAPENAPMDAPTADAPAAADDAIDPAALERAVAWLQASLPARDRDVITADYLRENARLALLARAAHPWSAAVPQELFDEYVLPYASVDEAREAWRGELRPIARQIVADATSCGEAAVKLNNEIFARLGVQYHATKRPRPNQSIGESRAAGYASCTGLSIILVNACRSVGIPARLVGVADWVSPAGPTYTGNGNHTWVEVWDGRQWRFLGAIEKSELDQTWFFDKTRLADESRPLTAIHATAWTPTGVHFPLVWNKSDTTIPATNVTRYYTRRTTVTIDAPADAHLLIRDTTTRRLAAAGSPGDFILAGGTTYELTETRPGQQPVTRTLTVP